MSCWSEYMNVVQFIGSGNFGHITRMYVFAAMMAYSWTLLKPEVSFHGKISYFIHVFETINFKLLWSHELSALSLLKFLQYRNWFGKLVELMILFCYNSIRFFKTQRNKEWSTHRWLEATSSSLKKKKHLSFEHSIITNILIDDKKKFTNILMPSFKYWFKSWMGTGKLSI